MRRLLISAFVLFCLQGLLKAQINQDILDEFDGFLNASEVASSDSEAYDVIAETVKTSTFGSDITPLGSVRWRVQVNPRENQFFAVKISTREFSRHEVGSVSTISAYEFQKPVLRCWNADKLVATIRVDNLGDALRRANVPDFKKVTTEGYPHVFLSKINHSKLLKTAATSFSLERVDGPDQVKFVMKNCGSGGNQESYSKVVCTFDSSSFIPLSLHHSEHGPPYKKPFTTYECSVLLADQGLPKVVSTSLTTLEEFDSGDTEYRIVFVQDDTSLVWVKTGDTVRVSEGIDSIEERKNFVMERP